jgi:hypothetical protein
MAEKATPPMPPNKIKLGNIISSERKRKKKEEKISHLNR